jgi:hypothetical protein
MLPLHSNLRPFLADGAFPHRDDPVREHMLAERREAERATGFDCRDQRRRCAGTDELLRAIAQLRRDQTRDALIA